MTISRRALLAAAAAAGGGLLTACGSNTGRGDGGGSGPALSHWYHQYGEAGTEQAVKRYAAAYTKARVTVQWRPGNYDQQTAAALLTDSGPDVFEVNGPSLDQIQGGQVVDLTGLLDGVEDDYNPVVLTPKRHDGKIWAIPQVIDMQMLYYRKSLLRDAGVEPPTTLDALVDAAKKLTTRKVKGLFLGNDGGAGVLGGTPLYAAGLRLVTDEGTVGFDDPAAARTLGKLHRLHADKSLLLGAPADWSDPSAFIQGLTAMQWTGLWALPQVQKELGDDFGVLPFPADGSTGRPAVPVGAYGAAVSARSRHVDAAEEYVKWLWVDRTDYQEDFALSYGFHIPARLSLAKKAAKLRTGAAADAVRFTTDHGWAQPLLWTPAAQTAYQDALSRIIKDGADPERELRTVVGKVSDELRRVQRKTT
ncbi:MULTISPECIES: ABC transporter substrate-binding protein [Streptomyces]|uniref:ABC transporter substrate-binding protein n=1 Tax=Streptomyces TaxID=1883 RepID=UPI00163BF9A5|nr:MULTISPECIES: sugar ABC transporter substrate-binding protein [Streptomyces]MCM3264182.1 sugar ABC transporter substrate-binding protein [Streptomyces thermoviolaceus]WTD49339.1 sugar ABC transporter substrate-binding protein [Streptomyces thermoviolaceus]GGV60577.1 sugar ABC transporter substrate-binding protein [Streptomyces thermoviolaceus subsp. apingens]GHA98244.1 sugar ABC transporter substrate-binding protein [Streptomyces thermoviolaceus subsp. thermoviolaceus]